MKRLLIFLGIWLLVFNLFSYSLLEREYGNIVTNIDSRTAAMGGTGVSGGNSLLDYTLNPANLALLPSGFGVQLTSSLMKNDDDRALPMYDFFDGYIDDATYVSNSSLFDEYAAALYYKHNYKDYGFSAAVSYLPYMNFDCYYEEEVRNDGSSDGYDYPQIIAKNFIEGDGDIHALALAAAFAYKKNYVVGLEVGTLSGENVLERRIIWSDYAIEQNSTLEDEFSKTRNKYDGLLFRLGALAKITERVKIGFSYTPQVEIDAEKKVDSEKLTYSLDNPAKMRVGFVYNPRNIMRTNFNCELEYVYWSGIESLFDDDINYYIGVEHQFREMLPLRIGFNYKTSYRLINDADIKYADKITMPTFAVGTGFNIMSQIKLDVSVSYSNRKYEALDLFMDGFYNKTGLWEDIQPQDRLWENPDQVTEKFIKIQASISYNW